MILKIKVIILRKTIQILLAHHQEIILKRQFHQIFFHGDQHLRRDTAI